MSVAYVTYIVASAKTHYSSVGVNTMPIYTVGADQPDVPLSVAPGCGNFTASTGTEIPFPAYADLNGSPDNPLALYQPSTGLDWELWQAARDPGGGISACWGGMLDTNNSNGVFAAPYGLSATGISYLATAITEADVASGHIDHAIALEIPGCDGYVYPADRNDCRGSTGEPPEGEWFRLPAGLQMPLGLTPFAQMVFAALQRYGLVVTDQADAVMLQAEQGSDWGAQGHAGVDPITKSWNGLPEYDVVADLPWDKLQAVIPPHP
jgi:hypothetical protein